MWSSRDKGQARVEPAVVRVLPPCQIHCPINEDIQRTNVLLSLLPTDPLAARQGLTEIGDYLFQRNPLFPVCGYVCGLCELGCNYGVRGGSIRRRLLKRFLAENYMDRLAARSTPDVDHPYEKVAIIGGGPAGLMAAYHLSIKGYQVSLFEASERLVALPVSWRPIISPSKAIRSRCSRPQNDWGAHCGLSRPIACRV